MPSSASQTASSAAFSTFRIAAEGVVWFTRLALCPTVSSWRKVFYLSAELRNVTFSAYWMVIELTEVYHFSSMLDDSPSRLK